MASPTAEPQAEDPQRAVSEEPPAAKPAEAEPGVSDADDAGTTTKTTEDDTRTENPSDKTDLEDGEVDASAEDAAAPPLPSEPTPAGPPLPSEPLPDDGWDCQWDANSQAWFFYNRFTGKTQWDNPRAPAANVPAASTAAIASSSSSSPPQPPAHEQPAAGGYNPAIHGDYDPNAWYAKGAANEEEAAAAAAQSEQEAAADMYAATVAFNRYSGGFQTEDMGPGRHSDDAKARRQMNAYFDSEAASAAHDGRSLRAERQNKKPSKSEVKAFKEKRRAKKEEKRRAWLRD